MVGLAFKERLEIHEHGRPALDVSQTDSKLWCRHNFRHPADRLKAAAGR